MKSRILLVLLVLVVAASSRTAHASVGSNSTIKGSYAFTIHGTILLPDGSSTPVAGGQADVRWRRQSYANGRSCYRWQRNGGLASGLGYLLCELGLCWNAYHCDPRHARPVPADSSCAIGKFHTPGSDRSRIRHHS